MADKKLWEVMDDAVDTATMKAVSDGRPYATDQEIYAAELRALADEVAPESEVPSDHEISAYGLHIAWVRWAAMHSFRQRLLKGAAEADAESSANTN